MSVCVIVDMQDAEAWPELRLGYEYGVSPGRLVEGSRRIPDFRRPTAIHSDRAIADQEALRLAAEYPERRFVVFEAKVAGITTKVPTHITIAGAVVAERNVPALADVDDDEIPF